MPKILVADDNSNIQKMVALAFGDHGIDVVAVGNGEAAVRKMADIRPDLVLADVFMPVRNGYEVCEFVKKDPRFSQVPVILLVGAFDPLDEKEARRVGADGVLKKPFVPPEPLIAMVTSVLEKNQKLPAEAPAAKTTEGASRQAGAALSLSAEPAPFPAAGPVVEPEAEPSADADEGWVSGSTRRPVEDREEEVPEFQTPPIDVSERFTEEARWSETATDWRRREALGFQVPSGLGAMEEVGEASEPEPTLDVGLREESQKLSPEPGPPASRAAEWMDLISPGREERASLGEEVASWAEHLPSEEQRVESTPAPSLEPPFFVPSGEGPLFSASGTMQESEKDSDFVAPLEAHVSEEKTPAEFSSRIGEKLLSAPADVLPFEHASEPPAPARPEVPLWPPAPPPETPWSFAPLRTDEPISSANATESKPLESEAAVPASEPAAAPAGIDPVTVDTIVSKVLDRIEPEIHEILAQGILRPLVETLLKRELDKN